jgi:hypothetical protein
VLTLFGESIYEIPDKLYFFIERRLVREDFIDNVGNFLEYAVFSECIEFNFFGLPLFLLANLSDNMTPDFLIVETILGVFIIVISLKSEIT